MWGGVHKGLSAAAVIILHYDRLRYQCTLIPDRWETTEDFIGKYERCTSSLSPTACINVLPTDFSLDCAAMQGFFYKQKLGVASLWGSCFLSLSVWHWLHAHICVSMNQFNLTADAMLRKYNYFHFYPGGHQQGGLWWYRGSDNYCEKKKKSINLKYIIKLTSTKANIWLNGSLSFSH